MTIKENALFAVISLWIGLYIVSSCVCALPDFDIGFSETYIALARGILTFFLWCSSKEQMKNIYPYLMNPISVTTWQDMELGIDTKQLLQQTHASPLNGDVSNHRKKIIMCDTKLIDKEIIYLVSHRWLIDKKIVGFDSFTQLQPRYFLPEDKLF